MSETFQANGIYTLLTEGQSVELHYHCEDYDYSSDDYVVVNGERVVGEQDFGSEEYWLLNEARYAALGDDPRILVSEREDVDFEKVHWHWHDRVVFSLATPIDGSAL